MRTIVHISDVHFGQVHNATLKPLITAVHALRPSVVVISGDLTQRALTAQFREARSFLLSLPGPQIVVPGNHDVSLINPIARIISPLRNFKRYITRDLYPFYEDDEIALLGINTARATMTKYGHISKTQLLNIQQRFGSVAPNKVKILVTHHPFDVPPGYKDEKQVVGKSKRAMRVLAGVGCDIFLAGHLHRGFTAETTERYSFAGYSSIVVQAGTATAYRKSSEANSFNLVRIDGDRLWMARQEYDAESEIFREGAVESFTRSSNGWSRSLE